MLEALQKIVRWMFMRIENIFNHTFGDKLNPFYHLGTISFYQFWLVIGSGLYLWWVRRRTPAIQRERAETTA